MHSIPTSVDGRASRTGSPRPFLSLSLPGTWAGALALAIGGSLAEAQTAYLASTTSDVAGVGGTTDAEDADWIALDPAGSPWVQLGQGQWNAVVGYHPTDVDGLALWPFALAGQHQSIAFSYLSNEGGVLDGDVVRIAPGGMLEVLVPETEIVAALGVPSANVDVDAVSFDDQQRLLYSLQSDLDGTVFGTVCDGDVLRLEHDGSATRLLTESDVEAKLLAATGLTFPIGDVQAIDFAQGEVRVVVQAPSSVDGALLSCGASPALVFDEAAVGMGGEELDALASMAPSAVPPRIVLDPPVAMPGDVVQASVLGGQPGHPVWIVSAGDAGYVDASFLPGFGGWFVDPNDPVLAASVQSSSFAIAPLDGAGSYATSFALPVGTFGGSSFTGGMGWTFQTVDLVTLEVSAPFRIEL